MTKVSKNKPVVGKPIFARFFNGLQNDGLESLGLYYSFYRAIVSSVSDPENANRLQLIIPDITGDLAYEEWASPLHNFSGYGYGIQCLPKPGDMVWVTFEQGNPEFPLWLHGYFGSKEKPKGELLGDLDSFFFITPKGHKIILNDTKDTISIEHYKGDKVRIDNNGIQAIAKESISLGSENKSKEKAVLGETNAEVLVELADGILAIIDAFSTAAVATDGSGAAFKANLIASTLPLKLTLENLKNTKVPKTTSNKVTLD